jgi:hypothetical protein
MKYLFLIVAVCALTTEANAGDCAGEESADISQKCKLEIVRAMSQDQPSLAVRTALEKAFPLSFCREQDADKLEITYSNDEAVGPILEATTFVGCESDNGEDGYFLTGEYYLDGESYRFKQIKLSTFE